jgi:hypothetical protein
MTKLQRFLFIVVVIPLSFVLVAVAWGFLLERLTINSGH